MTTAANGVITFAAWLTSPLNQRFKTKSQYSKLHRQGHISEQVNNKLRNEVHRELGRAKQTYFCDIFSNSESNMKKKWETLNEMMGRKPKATDMNEMVFDNV